jgi:Na+/melibiose symporter-like transporter
VVSFDRSRRVIAARCRIRLRATLRALFSIAPAEIYFLSAIVFSRYPITRDPHRQMRERLATRAAEPAVTDPAAS